MIPITHCHRIPKGYMLGGRVCAHALGAIVDANLNSASESWFVETKKRTIDGVCVSSISTLTSVVSLVGLCTHNALRLRSTKR